MPSLSVVTAAAAYERNRAAALSLISLQLTIFVQLL